MQLPRLQNLVFAIKQKTVYMQCLCFPSGSASNRQRDLVELGGREGAGTRRWGFSMLTDNGH